MEIRGTETKLMPMVKIENSAWTPVVSYGDLAWSVEASCGEFRGINSEVWFARDDINRFIVDLTLLEERRSGSAVLMSMSAPSPSNEFHLEFYMLDKLGHVAVSLDLLKGQYVGYKYRPMKLSLAFEFDPGYLRTHLEEFKAMAQYGKSTFIGSPKRE